MVGNNSLDYKYIDEIKLIINKKTSLLGLVFYLEVLNPRILYIFCFACVKFIFLNIEIDIHY